MMKQTDAYVAHLFEGAIKKRICPPNKRDIHASAKYLRREGAGLKEERQMMILSREEGSNGGI